MDDERLVSWIGEDFPRPIQTLVDRIVPGFEPTVGAEQGWWPLLVRLDAHLSAIDPDYRVRRITVSDGCLCFEIDDARPAELDAVISAAVEESTRTCEICGNPGTPQRAPGSFYSVLCEDDSREGRVMTTVSDRFRPVVALDVDGVMRIPEPRRGEVEAIRVEVTMSRNAYPRLFHRAPRWDSDGTFTGTHFFSAAGVQWVRSLVARGVDVWWCTTWQDCANRYFSPRLELPTLPVITGDPLAT